MASAREHRANIHSTNPLERVNGEIKRKRGDETHLSAKMVVWWIGLEPGPSSRNNGRC
jgi:hypothetical protein